MIRAHQVGISAGLILGAIALTACGPNVTGDIFDSVNDCQFGGYDSSACEQAYADALASHRNVGPRYENQSLCEVEFGVGNCEPAAFTTDAEGLVLTSAEEQKAKGNQRITHSYAGGYMPGMSYWMVGYALGASRYYGAQPVYRPGGAGGFITGSGRNLGTSANGIAMNGRSFDRGRPPRAASFTRASSHGTSFARAARSGGFGRSMGTPRIGSAGRSFGTVGG